MLLEPVKAPQAKNRSGGLQSKFFYIMPCVFMTTDNYADR